MKRVNPPISLYSAEGCRQLDQVAIVEAGISGIDLMERAGGAAYRELRRCWPRARDIVIVCGTGNNGGDGFVVARLARLAGLQVRLVLSGDASRLGGDALLAYQQLAATGLSVTPAHALRCDDADVIVDALFGTDLARDIAGPAATLIDSLNHASAPVLALDVPSGLDASTGRILGVGVHASVTVSFIAHKVGLHTGQGREHCGRIVLADLGVPTWVHERITPRAKLLAWDCGLPALPLRPRGAYKNSFGHVLVIGGELGFSGAVQLTALAAARCGAGLTSIATRPVHAPVIAAAQPELMCRGVEHAADLDALLAQASVIAIGPGLGRSSWGKALLEQAGRSGLPMVVDADALNLLAVQGTPMADEAGKRVFTPHPGEAGRLLGMTASGIECDRVGAIFKLRDRYGGSWILKGAGSLILGEDELLPGVCAGGNPGMATAGSGDVLTGVIAGLMAQGLASADAAKLGAGIHATAGDRAAVQGERGLMAGDLIERLRPLVNVTSS